MSTGGCRTASICPSRRTRASRRGTTAACSRSCRTRRRSRTSRRTPSSAASSRGRGGRRRSPTFCGTTIRPRMSSRTRLASFAAHSPGALHCCAALLRCIVALQLQLQRAQQLAPRLIRPIHLAPSVRITNERPVARSPPSLLTPSPSYVPTLRNARVFHTRAPSRVVCLSSLVHAVRSLLALARVPGTASRRTSWVSVIATMTIL